MYNNSRNPAVHYSLERLSGALQKMLRNCELKNIHISDLCSEAGVSRNSYYNNCTCIMDVIDYSIDQCIEEAYSLVDQTHDPANTIASLFFGYWYKKRDFLMLLQQRGLYKRFSEKLTKKGSEKTKYPILRDNSDTLKHTMVNAYILGGFCAILECWAKTGFTFTPEQLAEIVMICGGKMAPTAERSE